MNLIQFAHPDGKRGVGIAENGMARVLDGIASVYDLAWMALDRNVALKEAASQSAVSGSVELGALLAEGRLLSPVDHPDPAHLYVTGTGLTHLGSASARNAMHTGGDAAALTDSMKMFRMGIEGGKPQEGEIGVQPEWFYKGNGHTVVATGQPLPSPHFALDGSEEPELAGIYIIDRNRMPRRLGFALANEFSDHVTERQNYLYLAHSKLRHCAVGPELRVGELPDSIEGTSRIYRNSEVFWEKPFLSGEDNMSHTFANLEHHHFKYDLFREPGDVHIHMFGTATLSFSDDITVKDGDVFEIEATGFGVPLRNPMMRVATQSLNIRSL